MYCIVSKVLYFWSDVFLLLTNIVLLFFVNSEVSLCSGQTRGERVKKKNIDINILMEHFVEKMGYFLFTLIFPLFFLSRITVNYNLWKFKWRSLSYLMWFKVLQPARCPGRKLLINLGSGTIGIMQNDKIF